jgi:hypothetical protein
MSGFTVARGDNAASIVSAAVLFVTVLNTAFAAIVRVGATVIVHGRSTEKSEKAAGAVRAAGGENATVHALAADLASLKQVHDIHNLSCLAEFMTGCTVDAKVIFRFLTSSDLAIS